MENNGYSVHSHRYKNGYALSDLLGASSNIGYAY